MKINLRQTFECTHLFPRLSCIFLPLLVAGTLSAQTPTATLTATFNASSARSTPIPNDFLGLSLPMAYAASAYAGAPLLTGNPGPFNTMFSLVGFKSLRVGGTSAETGTYPTTSDGFNANDFINATGANLIWTLPVGANYNDATYTSYAQAMIADKTSKNYPFSTTFEIGNEFEHYISYSTYQTRFDAYNASIRAQIGSATTTTGPSGAGSFSYSDSLATDATYAGSLHSSIGFITEHYYPGGNADHIANSTDAIATLLSPSIETSYQSFYNSFSAKPLTNGFIPRYEETGSVAEGGVSGASNAYASALWVLDYLCPA